MRCANCEAEIPDGEKFCPQCGVPVGEVLRCPHCDAALLPGERFCGECGKEIELGPPALQATPPPAKETPAKKGRPVWFWVLLVVGIVALISCLSLCGLMAVPALLATPSPTSTPTATPTSTSTPTPLPTATYTSTPGPTPTPTPSLGVGMLLVEEGFTSVGDDWEIGESEEAAYDNKGGKYSIQVNAEHWMAWEGLGEELGDFVIEFETTLVDGHEFNSSGILFRFQDKDNFYSLDINGNNKYSLGKEVDGEWFKIIDWTASELLRPKGQPNVIRLTTYGDTFWLYINGQLVGDIVDTSHTSGDIAFHVTAYDDPPARATFDDLYVWDVELR